MAQLLAKSGQGNKMCNFLSMKKDIIDEKYVIFNTTNDVESKEILECLRAVGLEQLCYRHLEIVHTYEALEFLYNLEETDEGFLKSTVEGINFTITDEDFSRIFGLQSGSIDPTTFSTGIEEKAYLRDVLMRPANNDQLFNVKAPYLRRKYMLLLEIVSKVILCITHSLDALTTAKMNVMAGIISKADNLDWLGLIKGRIVKEAKKFGLDENNNVVLTSKCSYIHKISILVADKLPSNFEWKEEGTKIYLARQ